MNQDQRRRFLLGAFLTERDELKDFVIPETEDAQRSMLRSLMNVRQPGLPSQEVLDIQDEYLRSRTVMKGIVRFIQLEAAQPHIYLMQGDITTLECDAIVNSANSGMTGCWSPNHTCIDNSIHTFAGVQLRWECDQIMRKQAHPEPMGDAKITSAYNLPCEYIIHTVGPTVEGALTPRHRFLLASSYRNCYALAKEKGLKSLAFCCISTDVQGFPQKDAAQIAIGTIMEMQANDPSPLDVAFVVSQSSDLKIYCDLLLK